MKLFVVLSIVVVGAFASNRMQAVGECMEKHKVDAERIQGIICKGPVNATEECFLDCSMQKMGMIDDKGNFNLEKAKKEVEDCKELPQEQKDAAVKLLETCSSVECSGECKCGAAAIKCLSANFGAEFCSVMFSQ